MPCSNGITSQSDYGSLRPDGEHTNGHDLPRMSCLLADPYALRFKGGTVPTVRTLKRLTLPSVSLTKYRLDSHSGSGGYRQ